MKKYALDLSIFILIFLFSIFALCNIGFLFHLKINSIYILLSLIFSFIYLYKSGNFIKKTLILFVVFLISFILSNCFIDTSFDGRCYHFTIENLLKLGYNPIYDNIKEFGEQNNIYYNLIFASSYPNAIETIRACFYNLFNYMESTKTVNYLMLFASFFYTFYFFNLKLNKPKSLILALSAILCSVVICQMNTKMVDFGIYILFLFQIFSLLLIKKGKIHNIIFIISCVLSIAAKYTGLLNTSIILLLCLIFYRKKALKNVLIICFSGLILCFQPYITNIIKYKNPLYPSFGYNKLDFMTKQNPKEFINKPYVYKFVRSMFSSSTDSRISDINTPKLHYKIPFTSHFDMPYIYEDIRINGFGHLFSGIFLISIFLTIIQFRKKAGLFVLLSIILTTILNPICWWARFVPQLHLLPVINCYYFRKNKIIFYVLGFLLLINGLWIIKENFSANAYRTYVMNSFYNDLYQKSQDKKLNIYIDKTQHAEDDATILARLNEYGINYNIVYNFDESYKQLKTDISITQSYKVKY